MYINRGKYRVKLVQILPYIVNGYLLLKLLFDQHGFFAILNLNKVVERNNQVYVEMKKTNDIKEIKEELINENIVNIRYLDEVVRLQYSLIKPDEKVLIIGE